MSFRCGKCGEAQPPRTKPVRVVIETRQKEYYDGRGGRSWGTETKREENRCGKCPYFECID